MERELHLVQDALESFCVFKLTELSEKDNLSQTNDSDKKFLTYKKYCDDRNINPSTDRDGKKYYDMYNEFLPKFWENLKEKYPNLKFNFLDVEKDFRNLNKKGDFVIEIESITDSVSVSLKAYKKSINRIQVCSGTFNSFITNFLFEKDGVGMFKTRDGIRFKGSKIVDRDREIKKLGLDGMLPTLHEVDKINLEVKELFVYSEKAKWYQNIKGEWENGHYKYGHRALDLILPLLREHFTNEQIKDRIIEMIGFGGEEELLLLDPKKMIDSITNNRFQELIEKVRSNSTMIYRKHGKSILFEFIDEDGNVILGVEVPFCLHKNGGWFLPKDKKGRFYPKENMFLEYGQRRPTKSKAINTSINTYVNLSKTGIFK
jgi:hypothetical protein|tara:strand:+ start:88 stop:1209 length:1122 start_codon:yes stop_codon:yes gene_type:complete